MTPLGMKYTMETHAIIQKKTKPISNQILDSMCHSFAIWMFLVFP